MEKFSLVGRSVGRSLIAFTNYVLLINISRSKNTICTYFSRLLWLAFYFYLTFHCSLSFFQANKRRKFVCALCIEPSKRSLIECNYMIISYFTNNFIFSRQRLKKKQQKTNRSIQRVLSNSLVVNCITVHRTFSKFWKSQ